MKITVRLPAADLADAMRFTKTGDASKAIVIAVQDFNRRHRMSELLQHAGTCSGLLTVDELQAQRRES